MASFSAYFDASGTSDTQVITVAGFVSTVKKWIRFEEEWQAILRREGVKVLQLAARKEPRGAEGGGRMETDPALTGETIIVAASGVSGTRRRGEGAASHDVGLWIAWNPKGEESRLGEPSNLLMMIAYVTQDAASSARRRRFR